MDWYHPQIGLVSASSSFILDGVKYPAGYLRQHQPGGFLPVRAEARPDDKLFFVSDSYGAVENGEYVLRWNAQPRDPADIARVVAREQIDRLEKSITDRMWREDAIGSAVVITIKKTDIDGNVVDDMDDPRHGKTASQYIAWVDAAIAALVLEL